MGDTGNLDAISHQTVAILLDRLQRAEAERAALMHEQLRLQRRWRLQNLGLIALVLLTVVSATVAQSYAGRTQSTIAKTDTAPPEQRRAQLLEQLSPEEREKVQAFEQQVSWLSQYMQSMDRFDAGAAVALFLSKMTQSVSAVPEMHREMQLMNVNIAAVPAIVAEMQSINAKLGVMTAAMDSTLGRSGRMMPCSP